MMKKYHEAKQKHMRNNQRHGEILQYIVSQ